VPVTDKPLCLSQLWEGSGDTGCSCDRRQELETRSGIDDLGPLRQMQLAVAQQGH